MLYDEKCFILVYLCVVYLTTLSISQTMGHRVDRIMNWKGCGRSDCSLSWSILLSRNLLQTEAVHWKSQPGLPVSGFKPGIFKIRSRNASQFIGIFDDEWIRNLCSTRNTVGVIKSKKMKWEEHMADEECLHKFSMKLRREDVTWKS
jgi:hypothetical protein